MLPALRQRLAASLGSLVQQHHHQHHYRAAAAGAALTQCLRSFSADAALAADDALSVKASEILEQIQAAGTLKVERQITTPQAAFVGACWVHALAAAWTRVSAPWVQALRMRPHTPVPCHASLPASGVLERPQPVLNFCSNNYLGLSNHPQVVAAAHAALDSHGFGLSSVRFICGTQVRCVLRAS
jgi:hypothetical protein